MNHFFRHHPVPTTANASGMISLSGLGFGHGATALAPPFSLSIRPGTATVLIGANGAGKSTLLRTLAGHLPAVTGTVTAWGEPLDERSPLFRRRVATVFDDDAFFSELSVREHLVMVAAAHATPSADSAVDRELAAFGLWAVADSSPLALSSGQRRRLLLAAAFVRPAELVMLDEPEQRLDTGMKASVIDRLAAARDRGQTVVAASHDRDVIERLADVVVVITDDGVMTVSPAVGATELAGL